MDRFNWICSHCHGIYDVRLGEKGGGGSSSALPRAPSVQIFLRSWQRSPSRDFSAVETMVAFFVVPILVEGKRQIQIRLTNHGAAAQKTGRGKGTLMKNGASWKKKVGEGSLFLEEWRWNFCASYFLPLLLLIPPLLLPFSPLPFFRCEAFWWMSFPLCLFYFFSQNLLLTLALRGCKAEDPSTLNLLNGLNSFNLWS